MGGFTLHPLGNSTHSARYPDGYPNDVWKTLGSKWSRMPAVTLCVRKWRPRYTIRVVLQEVTLSSPCIQYASLFEPVQ